MDFARLFPPGSRENKLEWCTIGEQTCRLDETQFFPIVKAEVPDAAFVDGGSAVLFATPARCFGLIKVAVVHTAGLKRKEVAMHSYLVSITANGGSFLVRSEALGGADKKVSACLDGEFTIPEATPEMLLDPLRTLAEYAVAPDGLVVHDGSLRNPVPYLSCKPKDTAVAVAKTSGVLTSGQRPVGLALLHRSPAGAWRTHLATNGVQTHAAKLHERSGHIFFIEGKRVSDEVFSLLAAWSADMSFPGYPYPLILADQLARVTNNERDAWRMILSSDQNAAKILSDELKANDAHAMLEHILYGKN
jgi:hypothetical protein